MKIRFAKGDNYIQLFNFSNGQAVMIEKIDFRYRKEGPLLIDVSITNRCERQCDFCYRNSKKDGYDMLIDDYLLLLSQAKRCGVQQIAIGGGEPTLHPNFIEILEKTSKNGLIPNYSTNADHITDEILVATKKYCGAMAISIYGDIENYKCIVERIVSFGITVNLHIILRRDLIAKHITLLRNPPKWLSQVNAIIFLNYKPANGRTEICLNATPKEILESFFVAVREFEMCSVGFDTCSVSFISNFLQVDASLFDYCEAARKSAYINEKLRVYPCSFYNGDGVDLHSTTLQEIWSYSPVFIKHRAEIFKLCSTCSYFEKCHFGCVIYDINNCNFCQR